MRYILLLITSLTIFNSSAQSTLGVKIGANFANIQSVSDGEKEIGQSIYAPHAGIFVKNKLSKAFSIQPEMLISLQGTGYFLNRNLLKEQLYYLNVPLLFKVSPSGVFSFYVGPQFGMVIGSNSINGSKVDFFYKEFDFSLSSGVEFSVTENIRLGGRYNLGLSNINDDPDYDDVEMRHRVIQIYISLLFNKSKSEENSAKD